MAVAKKETAAEEQGLIEFKPDSLRDVYTDAEKRKPYLDQIQQLVEDFTSKVEGKKLTPAKIKEIKSFAYKLRRSKTAIDEPGKTLVAEYKSLPKLIDEGRREFREFIDEQIDKVMEPVTQLEREEQERVAAIRKRIDDLQFMAEFEFAPVNVVDVQNRICQVEKFVVDKSFEELEAEAAGEKVAVLQHLKVRLDEARKDEELAELRRKEAQRAQTELAERQAREKVDRENREERERLAKKAAELEVEAARITSMRQQNPEPAQVEAIAALNARVAPSREQQATVHRNLVANLVDNAGISGHDAKAIIAAIWRGQVPELIINYEGN